MGREMVKIPHKIVVAVMARVRVSQGRNGESDGEQQVAETGGFHKNKSSSSRAKFQSVPDPGWSPISISAAGVGVETDAHHSLLQLLRDEFLAHGLG